METKNVVIAMLCASIAILSVATPISAVTLDGGIGGFVAGDGSVTGEVVVSANAGNPDGTGAVEASMEATAELNGPGVAVCIGSADLTSTLTTPLGTIEATSEGSVAAAVEVEEVGSASADAYVGTEASLDASEVVIESEISSGTGVETEGGSASASASASGTTIGEGESYATGGAPNNAYSYANVSGATNANAAVNDTAGAGSYAVVKSTDYAGHNVVSETSNIGASSYGWSDNGNASANSNAAGEAYQYGEAENCASSTTYAAGMVDTAVMTMGPESAALSDAHISSYDYASTYTDEYGTKYGSVSEGSNIGASSDASSVTDGAALAASGADGYTFAYGDACGCVYSDTYTGGMVGTLVETAGPASAQSDAHINSYDSAYTYPDADGTKYGSVSESTNIYSYVESASGNGGATFAASVADGYSGAYGGACGCVYSDTYTNGMVGAQVMTAGPASAQSDALISSYDYALTYPDEDGTKSSSVSESSNIYSHAKSASSYGGATFAASVADGYTRAYGGACGCVYSSTYADGMVGTQVGTAGPASADAFSHIWSTEQASVTDGGAYVHEDSSIYVGSYASSKPRGAALAISDAYGYTSAYGYAGCLDSVTYATGTVDATAESADYGWISTYARLTSDGWIVIGNQAANSVIVTGATAMHNSDSAGEANADGITHADAYNWCTGEWVATYVDAEGETVVLPFNVMGTWTAGLAWANAVPAGFEEVNQTLYIDTSGPTNVAFSWTDAIATTP